VVLAPWLEERHPDHAAAGALVTRAVFLAGVRRVPTEPPAEPFRPRQLLYYAMRHPFTPSFVVDTSAAAERKRAAIACHASQVGRRPGARDRYVGSLIGVDHGEALRMPTVPGLVDPVRHLRDNRFPEAHAFWPSR
jgi:LmbE family N-acetylglucosaminyl deacetylase